MVIEKKLNNCIWIISQEADHRKTGPHNRHYEFACELLKNGYSPIVFAASATRQSGIQVIQNENLYQIDDSAGFPFVFVKTPQYKNMKERLLAVALFHKRLRKILKQFPEPKVILGSSAYPLSPYIAIKEADKVGAKSICEVRDLWPLSLEEYGIISKGGFVSRFMYRFEKYLYENSDEIIFTFPGGKQYIKDRKLDLANGGKVDPKKIASINNGVNIDLFQKNRSEHYYENDQFNNFTGIRLVYTGSIRKANNLNFLLDVMKLLSETKVRLYLFGRGEREQSLKERCEAESIHNVCFMGWVQKKYVPSILSQADLAIEFGTDNYNLMRYGTSPNKLFDYFASGTPVISNHRNDLSIINQEDCGIERSFSSSEECAELIQKILSDEETLNRWKINALHTAEKYSFSSLTERLIEVIEQ